MKTEFEAKFLNINKNEIRKKLKTVGANLIKPEYLQKRMVFFFPKGHELSRSWIRVRDEADKITMGIKSRGENIKNIENQKEISLDVSNFEQAIEFLELIGCKSKSYQENKREIWHLDSAEICLDEWPFLEPLIEIEAQSEEIVRMVSQKLDFDYKQALFCDPCSLYIKKYNVSFKRVSDQTPKIVFNMTNPFLD